MSHPVGATPRRPYFSGEKSVGVMIWLRVSFTWGAPGIISARACLFRELIDLRQKAWPSPPI